MQYVGKGGGHLKPPARGVRAFNYKDKLFLREGGCNMLARGVVT